MAFPSWVWSFFLSPGQSIHPIRPSPSASVYAARSACHFLFHAHRLQLESCHVPCHDMVRMPIPPPRAHVKSRPDAGRLLRPLGIPALPLLPPATPFTLGITITVVCVPSGIPYPPRQHVTLPTEVLGSAIVEI
ncbi:hypothetical protein F4859DRAFT_147145 [Xylaria cf. heliscus]|nr:hypothetical protein F4859DRAFT_147145 [Xylaria cf. heliscus]